MLQQGATTIESIPGERQISLCDAAVVTGPGERLPGDYTIGLEQADRPGLVRMGKNASLLRYDTPHGEAPRAALVALGLQDGVPVAADPGSLAVLALADRVAQSEIPVLIEGPTGTGKEVLSRYIHDRSPRSEGPFIAINCAAMPETMLEALLFGHQKGSFTGASAAGEGFFRAADGGTLLLDEIAEMPLGLQAKLLRALQEGEVVPLGATQPVKVDVRVIACCNRDLPTEVEEGRFRADLYYRLNVFPLALPALRERPADIAPLAVAMILRHGELRGVEVNGSFGSLPWLSEGAIAKLRGHSWPGNVRELENVVRRALVLAGKDEVIEADHIQFDSRARALPPTRGPAEVVELAPAEPAPAMPQLKGGRLSKVAQLSEAQEILRTLDNCGGSRVAAARELGISERTLRYRLANMREAGIVVDKAAAGAAR